MYGTPEPTCRGQRRVASRQAPWTRRGPNTSFGSWERNPAGVRGRNATSRIGHEAHLRLVRALEGEHVAEHGDDVGHGSECWTLRRRRLRLWRPERGTRLCLWIGMVGNVLVGFQFCRQQKIAPKGGLPVTQSIECGRGWLPCERVVETSPGRLEGHRKEMTRYADYGCVRQPPHRTLPRERTVSRFGSNFPSPASPHSVR